MLYMEIIAVCSEIYTEHINTLCGQNVELLNVKLAVYQAILVFKYSKKDFGSTFHVCLVLLQSPLQLAAVRRDSDIH